MTKTRVKEWGNTWHFCGGVAGEKLQTHEAEYRQAGQRIEARRHYASLQLLVSTLSP